MLINVAPILPLDGGRILKAVLTRHLGFIRAFKITNIISIVNILLLGVLGLVVLWLTRFNVSVAMLSAFLIYNIGSEKQNSSIVIMKELANYPNKLKEAQIITVKELAAMGNTPSRKLLGKFSYNHFYFVHVMKDDASALGTLSETQIVDAMVKMGSDVTLYEVLGHASALHDLKDHKYFPVHAVGRL